MAEEVRAPDVVDNARGRRRKAAQVLRLGQHGRNIETSQQQREHGIAGTYVIMIYRYLRITCPRNREKKIPRKIAGKQKTQRDKTVGK